MIRFPISSLSLLSKTVPSSSRNQNVPDDAFIGHFERTSRRITQDFGEILPFCERLKDSIVSERDCLDILIYLVCRLLFEALIDRRKHDRCHEQRRSP